MSGRSKERTSDAFIGARAPGARSRTSSESTAEMFHKLFAKRIRHMVKQYYQRQRRNPEARR